MIKNTPRKKRVREIPVRRKGEGAVKLRGERIFLLWR